MKSDLMGIPILSFFTRKSDLINYFNKLHEALSRLSQEPSDQPQGLRSTALQLVSSKIINYNDKDIRLLCTCCIVDVLRIFAPEAPYSNEDMLKAFDAITSQIRGLATYDSIDNILCSKAYYILNSISTLKSCVVPVILAQSGVIGAEDVVVAMFEAILSSLRLEHPQESKNFCYVCVISELYAN